MALETVLEGLAFPEGPRWREGELVFSDMHAHEVVAVTPEGRRRTVYAHDGPVSGLGWLPDGRMLVVSMPDTRVLAVAKDGKAEAWADISSVATFMANDMVVDAKGGAYVGNFGYDFTATEPKPATLAYVDPEGRVSASAGELIFPNGMVITPDGGTLVVGETFAGRLTAFDIAADGSLSNRRVWATLPDRAAPDGICLDAEGAIWVASPMTREALRVREGGEVTDRIAAPVGVYACMLGSDDRRTLLLAVAGGHDPASCRELRAGAILAHRVDVPGAGWP